MLCSCPFSRNEHPLENRSKNLDDTGNDTTDGGCCPFRRGSRLVVDSLNVVPGVQGWCVVGGVHPVDTDMDNPNSVEIGDEMQPSSDFLVSLEKDVLPFDFSQFQESLFLWDIHQSGTITENDSGDTLWVPEQSVDIIITNDIVVVLFTLDESTFVNFVDLRSQETVERGDDSVQVVTLWHRFLSLLTLRRHQVVNGGFVDVTKTFGRETNSVSLTPQQQVKGNVSDSFLWGQDVHLGFPLKLSCIKRVVTLQFDSQSIQVLAVLFSSLSSLLGLFRSLSGLSADLAQVHVSKTDRVIQVLLRGKKPFLVVGVVTTNVVSVQGQQSSGWRHTGRSRVQQSHQIVKHVSHGISLETKLVRQIDEDIFNVLDLDWGLWVSRPSWIWQVRGQSESCWVVVRVATVDWSGGTGRSGTTVTHSGWGVSGSVSIVAGSARILTPVTKVRERFRVVVTHVSLTVALVAFIVGSLGVSSVLIVVLTPSSISSRLAHFVVRASSVVPFTFSGLSLVGIVVVVIVIVRHLHDS